MASRIKGITIEIDGNTTKLDSALKDVNKTIYSTNSELKDLNKALKLDPKNTELLAQKQDVLKKNIEATTKKLSQLKTAQKQMGDYSKLTDEQKENYRTLSIEITNSESALKNLTNEYKNFGSVANQQLKNVGEQMKKTGNDISSAGKKLLTITAGVTALGVASAKSAGELEQSLGGAKAVFKDYYDNIVEDAKNSAKVMGTSTNEYLENANKIGSLMQGSGLDTKTTYELTTKGMQRAADVASIMGIDISSALEAIAGAAKGNFTMMDNLGVAMNATTLQSYALSKGIKTAYNDMTNAEKIQLAYTMFLEQTTDYAGNYVKENDTLNGSLTTTTANIKNLSASIGEKLLPIANKIVDAVSKLVDKFSELDDKTQNIILIITGAIATLGPVLIIIGKVISAIGVISSAITKLGPIIKAVGAALTGTVGVVAAAVVAGIAIIVVLYNKCEWFRNYVNTIVKAIIDYIKSIPENIKNAYIKVFEILSGFVTKFKEIGTNIIDGLIDGLSNVGTKIKDTVKNIGDKIVGGFKDFFHIKSPSRLMSDKVGTYIGEGVIEGILNGLEETEYKVNNAMRELAGGIETSVNPTINPSSNSNPLIIQIENFNNNSESDIQQLAQKLEFYRRNSSQARGGN